MLATRSAVYKMVRQDYSERKIHSLPRPFISNATPNKQINFSRIARECSKCSVTAGLNISKAIFVGDVAVGKTSLVNRFCHRVFETHYKATIGVDFEVERFDILDVPFNLQIWDTAGQERFKCIAQSYYRGASAIVLVFSLCDPASLKHTKAWLFEAMKANIVTPLLFLVGTKRDKIPSSSYVAIEAEAMTMANELNAEYWAVSSKTGDCVNNLFNRIAALSFDKAMQRDYDLGNTDINIGNPLTLGKSLNKVDGKQIKTCSVCLK